MKTFIVAIVLIISLSCQGVFGQIKTEEKKTTVNKTTGDAIITESLIISDEEDITPRTNMIIVNPLKFLVFYNLSFFHKVNEQAAIGAGVQFPTISGIDGFGLNLELRLHPSKRTLHGFYIAPNMSYNKLSSDEDREKLDAFSLGALLGWQWFPGDDFAIGLGIGADYYISSAENSTGDLEKYKGFIPAVRFDIGYAW